MRTPSFIPNTPVAPAVERNTKKPLTAIDCLGFNGSSDAEEDILITCYLRYVVDPFKLKEFETYARLWIPLVEKFGGRHHGYFMPHEGANNIALALFSFPSLADYETYRTNAGNDPECQAAMRYYQETKCFMSYERSFMQPVFG